MGIQNELYMVVEISFNEFMSKLLFSPSET